MNEVVRPSKERLADVPREVLLGKTLRQRAHQLRIEACSAWSDVGDKPFSGLDVAKCDYARAIEERLRSVIDELADLSSSAETRAPLTVWGKPRWTIERPNEPCVNCGCTKFVCTACGGIPFVDAKPPAAKASAPLPVIDHPFEATCGCQLCRNKLAEYNAANGSDVDA